MTFRIAVPALALLMAGCSSITKQTANTSAAASDGPSNQGTPAPRQDGNAAAGRDVFRFETFGNEGFWTDAVRLPAGVAAAKVTPLKALQLGLYVDVDAIDSGTQQNLIAQLKADPSGNTSALLNDPAMTTKLINANAIIGMPIKDSNGDGVMDVTEGDKVGASCALCHTITDASVFQVPNAGSIGHRLDGRANHTIHMGAILATGANSRAYTPCCNLLSKQMAGRLSAALPKA